MRDIQRDKDSSLFSSCRVLDLTDEKGFLCGKILADLGADVIKIEKPDGHPSRNIGPFYHDDPDPQKSLYWFAYNANKRGVTLDIETSDGKEIFKRLVKTADCVIESFPPDYMDRLGLGYLDLERINNRIILTSISPFGQPYKNFKSSDITALAMGGLMYITGDPDRSPVRIGYLQSHLHASADAALATLMAYYYREGNGEGQHVDISIHQSFVLALFYVVPFWEFLKVISKRYGSFRSGLGTGVIQRMVWPCKDRFVNFTIMGGATGAKTNEALTEWMDSEGMAPDFIKKIDWKRFDMSQMTQELQDKLSEPISRFFMKHTKSELYKGAVERHIMLYPVCNSKDILEDPQLRSRGFWKEVRHPELDDTIIYPGGWMKSSEVSVDIRHRAPLIGEHNQEIYAELGLSDQELQTLKQAGVI